jgi:hypothetical protein
MECVQIVVQIESSHIISVLKEKGQQLGNLMFIHGNYAIFAGDSTFSWKWIASNLSFMDDWDDAECIEYWMDNNYIVAALWQYEGEAAATKWFACNGCSDDFIDDDKKVNKLLARVIAEKDVVKFEFNRQEWLNSRVKAISAVKTTPIAVSIPIRTEITRKWLLSLTPEQWNILMENNQVKYKILDEWENPIFKDLQTIYHGSTDEFSGLALQALKEKKDWKAVENISATPKPKTKPSLKIKCNT